MHRSPANKLLRVVYGFSNSCQTGSIQSPDLLVNPNTLKSCRGRARGDGCEFSWLIIMRTLAAL
ncbi:hypothetical protein ABIA43_004028 [Bradyrhizobium sp. USDA 328]